MKKISMISAVVAATIITGCGGSGSTNSNSGQQPEIDLPDGKALVFFDNASSKQYGYNTDTETFEDMNVAGENYDMTDKHGKLIVWHQETSAGEDQKIVMLHDDFDINEGNHTHNGFHYLGHIHEENNEQHFAAHSSDEFDPINNASEKKLATLIALNAHLIEQEEIKEEIEEALPSGETLCNFYVFGHEEHEEHAEEEGHEEHEEEEEHEAGAHIALTTSGKVYIYEEHEGELEESQSSFALDGVTACKENESSIIQNGEHGVLIFAAQSQKLYLADEHGADFHVHSTWDAATFLPAGFTPTMFAGIGEGDEDHDHDY